MYISHLTFCSQYYKEMGEGDMPFPHFPNKLTLYMVAMATILAEYYVKLQFL